MTIREIERINEQTKVVNLITAIGFVIIILVVVGLFILSAVRTVKIEKKLREYSECVEVNEEIYCQIKNKE